MRMQRRRALLLLRFLRVKIVAVKLDELQTYHSGVEYVLFFKRHQIEVLYLCPACRNSTIPLFIFAKLVDNPVVL